MKFIILLTIVSLASAIEYKVKSAIELTNALGKVSPGDTITLADGTYKGNFKITRSGASGSRITLTGSRDAVLTSDSYGLYVNADYWTLKGFTVANSKKGIMLDESKYNILTNLSVHHIEEECVHFRKNSVKNTIKNSEISYTGLSSPGTGEGVYIGTAKSNWEKVMGSPSTPDRSNRNEVLNNKFGPGIKAECIDIKEGTQDGLIDNNTFDGTGMSGENDADSWMDVKGSNYTITNNKGTKSLLDGFQTHFITDSVSNSGCGNTFKDNTCSKVPGVCVKIQKSSCSSTNVDSNNRMV